MSEAKRSEASGSTVGLGVEEFHHIWCNFFASGPAHGCEQCKWLYERYPMNGATGEELAAKHFPDAVLRKTPNV